MAGYDTFRALVNLEFTQSREEGRDKDALDALRPAFDAAGEDEARLAALWEQISTLPVLSSFPFDEPSDLATIRAKRPDGPRRLPLPYGDAALLDRLYGAWLGRSAGCALGKPVECFMNPHNGLSSKDRIKLYLTSINPAEWPLRDYIPAHSPAQRQTGAVQCPLSTREQIALMESDDDIRYTVLGQMILQLHGRDFTTRHVMQAWFEHLSYYMLYSAEVQAYRNAIMRYEFHCNQCPDEKIDWHWVATHQNPYREWIGAYIRADSFGYACPGNMELAAEFAWRDARMSHVKNGIYGEMFVAAMIAAAFVYDDPMRIVQAGLAEIPATSRLYRQMNQTIDICRRYDCRFDCFEQVLDGIYALLGHYHPVHTINNAALVVAALLLGGRDLEKVITLAVMGGWDTDCNAATAGSIVGAMLGAGKLPARWIDPLHDTLKSGIIDYHPIAIRECARRSLAIVGKVSSNAG